MGGYTLFLMWAGRITAGVGLLSFANKAFEIGIYGVLADVVGWYDTTFSALANALLIPVVWFLVECCAISPPEYLSDLAVLYFIFGAANLRAIDRKNAAMFLEVRDVRHKIGLLFDTFIRVCFWPIHVFLGPVVITYDYWMILHLWGGFVQWRDHFKSGLTNWASDAVRFSFEVLFVSATFLVFLSINTGLSYLQA